MDYTLKIYKKLIYVIKKKGYECISFKEYLTKSFEKFIILRHDVDDCPQNSLVLARIQAENNIYGSYYFRAVQKSWNVEIIKNIYNLGHEIGYHYESMATCKGDERLALEDFIKNLENLRKIVPVNTICMHGSPHSVWDSRDLWKKHNYMNYSIIGEPYFDINYNKIFNLTDTGRRWDGWKVSVRDKLPQQEKWIREGLVFHSTHDIIRAIEEGRFPKKVMMTFHPQRWTEKPLPWLKELLMQNIKNVAKGILIHTR